MSKYFECYKYYRMYKIFSGNFEYLQFVVFESHQIDFIKN